MKQNNNKGATYNNTVMRKLLPLLIISALIVTPSFAIFGLFEKPVVSTDMIFLDSIEQPNYGFNGTNSTCTSLNLQFPYNQQFEKVYVRVGYVPLCDINQSSYDEYLTIFNEGNYVASFNVTDNCVNNNGDFEGEWIEITTNNTQGGSFQTSTLTQLTSFIYCINDTTTIPRSDFWVRIENTGNHVVVETQTQEVFPELDIVVESISNLVTLVNSLIVLGITIVSGGSFVWTLFAMFLLTLYLFSRLRTSVKKMFRKK